MPGHRARGQRGSRPAVRHQLERGLAVQPFRYPDVENLYRPCILRSGEPVQSRLGVAERQRFIARDGLGIDRSRVGVESGGQIEREQA